jgi:Na+-driven multidrug efflux pump
MITSTLLLGCIIVGLGYIFLKKLLILLGTTTELLPYAVAYFQIVLLGIIFQMLAFVLTTAVKTEGKSQLALRAMLVSAVTNIVLDYLFIVVFKWGVRGAAWATIISQVTGFGWLLTFYINHKSGLNITSQCFIPETSLVLRMVELSFNPFITAAGASFALVVLNNFIIRIGGNPAIAAMGGINGLYILFIMPVMGMAQGVQPLFSYNFGAGLIERERRTLGFSFLLIGGFAVIVWAFMQIYPQFFMSFFLNPASKTLSVAIPGLRMFVCIFPLLSLQLLGASYLQATGQAKLAILLGALRQFILLIPIIFLLSYFWNLTGVWLATPAADAIAALITGIFFIRGLSQKNKNRTKSW